MRQKFTPPLLLWHNYLFLWLAGSFAAIWPLPFIISALLLLACNRQFWKIHFLLISFGVFALSFLLTTQLQTLARQEFASIPDWLNSSKRICGEISAVQELPENRLAIFLENAKPENNDAVKALPGQIRWLLQNAPENFQPIPGQTACVSRPLLQQRALRNSDYAQFDPLIAKKQFWRMHSRGNDGEPVLEGKGNWLARKRQEFKNEFLAITGLAKKDDKTSSSPPNQGLAILAALLFGDRSFLSNQTVNDFAAGSLAHSLALSGQHLAIAAISAIALVFAIGRIRPSIFLWRPRIYLIALLSVPFGLVYLWLGNAPSSLLRAFCMMAFATLWILRGKAWSGMDLLCASVLLLCCLFPAILFEAGMQFSVLCVLIITLFAAHIPILGKFGPNCKFNKLHCLLAGLWKILFISFVIQLFLLPLVLVHFGQASFWFPMNLLWLPTLAFFVLPCAFFALAIFPFFLKISEFAIHMAAFPCNWMLELLEFLRRHDFLESPALIMPHWTALLAFELLLCACASKFKKSKHYTAIFGCLALIFLAIGPGLRILRMLDATPELSILDVGQGQALLVKFDGYGQILVDGGGSYGAFDLGRKIVAPAIAQNWPPYLDAIINSHPDMDHLGGILTLLPYFKCGTLFHNGHELQNEHTEKWENLKASQKNFSLFEGDTLFLGDSANKLRLEVLHPPASGIPMSDGSKAPHQDYGGNNASLVLRLCHDKEGLAMLSGDIEKKVLKALAISGEDIKAKILVAPHHGSNTGLSPDFYKKSAPELVIASCGFQNRWGFPGKKLQGFLRRCDLPLLTTSELGRIDIKFAQNGTIMIKDTINKKFREIQPESFESGSAKLKK